MLVYTNPHELIQKYKLDGKNHRSLVLLNSQNTARLVGDKQQSEGIIV